jgi:hypothetical protein
MAGNRRDRERFLVRSWHALRLRVSILPWRRTRSLHHRQTQHWLWWGTNDVASPPFGRPRAQCFHTRLHGPEERDVFTTAKLADGEQAKRELPCGKLSYGFTRRDSNPPLRSLAQTALSRCTRLLHHRQKYMPAGELAKPEVCRTPCSVRHVLYQAELQIQRTSEETR